MSARRPVHALLAWVAVIVAVCGAWLWLPRGASAQGDTGLRGDEIYARTCAPCHGPHGQGRLDDPTAEGDEAAPPVRGLETAFVDLLVRTGRMPIHSDQAGVVVDRLGDEEREATVAWMTQALGLTGAIPRVRDGERTRGHELYAIHCAACHGATGQGGIGPGGTQIRGVLGLDQVAVVEAIRVGPFGMPRFTEDVIAADDANAIAAFAVQDLSAPRRTPIGLSEMHRITFWALASMLGVALVAAVVLVARPVPAPSRPARSRRPVVKGGRG